MNKVIDKGFRSCCFVSTIVKHPVYSYFCAEIAISACIYSVEAWRRKVWYPVWIKTWCSVSVIQTKSRLLQGMNIKPGCFRSKLYCFNYDIRLCRRRTTKNLGWWSQCYWHFFSKFERRSRQLLSPTIPTVLTRRSSPPLCTFMCKKRMFSQKERIESEVLTWRRALYCKKKNAVIEKAHGKELLS